MGLTSDVCSTCGATPTRCSMVVSRTAAVDLQASTDALRFHVGMGARGARLGALADNAADEPQLGEPTDVTPTIRWRLGAGAGAHSRSPRSTRRWPVAALSGSITLRDLDTEPVVDLALGMQHLDFAQLLGASGLAVPESLGMAPGAGMTLARPRSTCVYADAWRTLPRSR